MKKIKRLEASGGLISMEVTGGFRYRISAAISIILTGVYASRLGTAILETPKNIKITFDDESREYQEEISLPKPIEGEMAL